ncbi:MAG: tRNA (adenosine(37)-N6)-dimethylallyltransferase MiaA [Candidatus Omnitrophica bacterium]|nr:tRNA (adenosine(37)-N6)-dimethylallyltransferase MiaA [Candidatus Omnitrophota bacterium]MDE2215010.1 tRNA (adenosine(37)-N6)-dimethylallyltransferase MiaA [Candidatus Omnitrophota bacterium]MDE2232182.1 tRNA (adenosine(37)-N6)-dimethylallyltransferase MiaA [Candidatus Omnitrophota bacterium]
MKPPAVIFIAGPTAVGKSEAALVLGPRLDAEIICCDAFQVYREINIASDKPSTQARSKVFHHLVDVLSVTEEFNAARWQKLCLAAIRDVRSRGKMPLIVGGSGMYMSVLLDGIFEEVPAGKDIKEELSRELAAKGPAVLHERLMALDPQAASRIHPRDPQRIIRALQVVQSTGKPISQLQPRREGLWGKMPVAIFALNRPRQELYRRVDARVEGMFAQGIVEEIQKVSRLPLSATARKLIGIPEVTGYLNGEYDLDRAKYLMKLHTRHYAKRQLTWFRGQERLRWIDIAAGQSAQDAAEIIARHIEDDQG